MESDSVRSSGDHTLVEIWIEGKLREISVSRQAIEAFLELPPDRAAAMTDEERRDFIRTHLTLVSAAAKDQLRLMYPEAAEIRIEAGQLGARESARTGDRRRGERRKGDRRKANQPTGLTGDRRQGERRRGDRRKGDCRAPDDRKDS